MKLIITKDQEIMSAIAAEEMAKVISNKLIRKHKIW